MKKHNDDWEEFLKQREKEKPAEDAELEELLKHDHATKRDNSSKNISSKSLTKDNDTNSPTSPTPPNKLSENNSNITLYEEKYADKNFDIDSLSEEEILAGVTTYEEADRLYEETYKKYEEAFEKWETDPDNEEFQKQLDIASNINDIAQKRLSIFQERELKDLKQKRIQFEQSSTTGNKINSKKSASRTLARAIAIIAIISFFVTILLSANGVKYASTVFPCVMVVVVFVCIYKFYIAPQFKVLQSKANNTDQQNENNKDISTNSNNNTQAKPITKKSLMLNKIFVLAFLTVLMLCLFLAIFGGAKNNSVMIIIGASGFVGLILITAFISNITKKHKQNKNIKSIPITGIVKSCSPEVKNDENGNLNNFYKVVILANDKYYTCFSKNEYELGSSVTIYLNPKNKKKFYINE